MTVLYTHILLFLNFKVLFFKNVCSMCCVHYMSTCVHMCMHICVCACFARVCAHKCVCVCLYAYTCVDKHMHGYMHAIEAALRGHNWVLGSLGLKLFLRPTLPSLRCWLLQIPEAINDHQMKLLLQFSACQSLRNPETGSSILPPMHSTSLGHNSTGIPGDWLLPRTSRGR